MAPFPRSRSCANRHRPQRHPSEFPQNESGKQTVYLAVIYRIQLIGESTVEERYQDHSVSIRYSDFSLWPACARAQAAKAPYPVMAPLEQYLIPDEKAEIALARSAAPASISDAAEVMVLR